MDYKFGEKLTGTIWVVGVIAMVLCVDVSAGIYMAISAFILAVSEKLRDKKAFKEAFIANLIGVVLLALAIGLVITSKI